MTHRVRLSGADRTTGSIATSNAIVLPNVPGVVFKVMSMDGTRTLTVESGHLDSETGSRLHRHMLALPCDVVGRRWH